MPNIKISRKIFAKLPARKLFSRLNRFVLKSGHKQIDFVFVPFSYLSQKNPMRYRSKHRLALGAILMLFALQPVFVSISFAALQDQMSTGFRGESALLQAEAITAGWINLFDGRTLLGWKAESDADWHVDDHAIWVTAGQPGLLRTTSQFSDFELSLEFLADVETNSGVFIRTSPKPKSPADDCYEINIIRPGLHDFATGSIVARSKGESAGHPDGENWHSMRIIADGARIVVEVDGKQVVDFTDENPLERGFIGLQLNKGRVGFRNIRLRPLSMESLVDDGSPGNWNQEKLGGSIAEFSAEEKCLKLTGGPGQLESRESFGDFVLQARCRSDRAGTNSGIFFRCMPGSDMMGYECQIDNRQKSPDDNTPEEAGTGAIFRRTIARQVVARDGEWFTMTIAACGPHVSVWVDGIHVTDWSDTRPPNENPRRGLRLDAGTIMLQGHDPKTAVSFQHLKAVELRPRWPIPKE